jgi:FAD/FMN-containing dehydrogenase
MSASSLPSTQKNKPFQNWARNLQTFPRSWHRISHEEQLLACVEEALAEGRRIRPLGSRHSWSPIAAPDDIALETLDYNKILAIDAERREVTFQAGLRLCDLNAALARARLALPILGSITQQTLAGATATGTHGSSLQHGSLSSLITAMRLVTGQGEILTLREQDARLDAARLHLGAFGLVSTLTLKIDPAFLLCEEAAPVRWEEALSDLSEIAQSAEYIKLWWLPHTDHIQIFRYHRTHEPITFQRWRRWVDEALINRYLFPAMLALGRWRPALIPAFHRWLEPTYFKPQRRIGHSFDILPLAMPPIHREMEFSVPLEDAPAALAALREMVERERLAVNFILEIRFLPAEAAWLSPSFGRPSCAIGIYMADAPDLDAYFRLGQEILLQYKGRPHWGKEFWGDIAQIAPRYPRFQDAQMLANTLDPQGIFRNPFLQQFFSSSHPQEDH